MIEQGRHVCLLESGGLEADECMQDLADGAFVGRAIDLRAERRRQFGGTSTAWAGACAPLSPSDFGPRPWVGLDGWPYTYNDLLPFYQKAQAMFDIGPFAYDPAYWLNAGQPIGTFDQDHLETRIWQFSPRKNFGRAYHQRLKGSDKAFVLLNATATKILSDGTAGSIIGIEARSLDGRSATIRARLYVLACGGIDNPRLLLLSRDRATMGLAITMVWSADTLCSIHMSVQLRSTIHHRRVG
ncbi:MAG: GMC family oxidoreductase [Rhodospirillales bacterium]|nr:GMC family oxidoreductase [Rhodospirillales bacterium]